MVLEVTFIRGIALELTLDMAFGADLLARMCHIFSRDIVDFLLSHWFS
jgi:hypothetical protein